MVGGTKEWAVAEINCCIGCPHDCRYCYARVAALKDAKIDTAGEWSRMKCFERAVQESEKCFAGQVMFPTAHDIVSENLVLSIEVINRLLAAGNQVLIVSKPDVYCIEKLCDRFRKRQSQILFRFTITARDPEILSFWEPHAPGYRQRLESLQMAFDRGFQTSVSSEPMLDIEDCDQMVEELEPWVSHSIWLGKMNKIEERVVIDSPEAAAEVTRIGAEQSDERIGALYESLKNRPLVRWKESIKKVVGLPLATRSGLDI